MLIMIITVIRLHLLEPASSVGESTEGPLSTAAQVVHCVTRAPTQEGLRSDAGHSLSSRALALDPRAPLLQFLAGAT